MEVRVSVYGGNAAFDKGSFNVTLGSPTGKWTDNGQTQSGVTSTVGNGSSSTNGKASGTATGMVLKTGWVVFASTRLRQLHPVYKHVWITPIPHSIEKLTTLLTELLTTPSWISWDKYPYGSAFTG